MPDHITVGMPPDLLRRAKVQAKRLHTSIGQLIREGLLERLEFLEAKERIEEERKSEKTQSSRKLPTLEERHAVKLAGTTTTVATPPATPTTRAARPDEVATVLPPLEAVYQTEARKIFEALDDPIEKRLRTVEAIANVKKVHPLTYPADGEILLNLERAVIDLRAKAPPKRLLSVEDAHERRLSEQVAKRPIAVPDDDRPSTVIDPEKIESYGDVDGVDEDDSNE